LVLLVAARTQIVTYDGWAEISRSLFHFSPVTTSLYFVTYIVICNTVLINVVIAVLLEKMIDEEDDTDPNKVKC
jgi:hypothetical protein